MSQKNTREQIERFLSSKDPEVLSVSGLWGVGKTHLWKETLKANRASATPRDYAYVSLFGIRNIDALTTAIVQSTVSLDSSEIEPTLDSYIEHLSSIPGASGIFKWGARKFTPLFGRAASTLPYVGKFADLFAPAAALLIRKQIICIDDIERAGHGLDIADVLGLVSTLCERRGCKVVLLLNEDALGEKGEKYRTYIEKVVDQAIKFEPTPEESAVAAIAAGDVVGQQLVKQTVALGIKNIRVICRIRRFLQHLESEFPNLHDGVVARVIRSIALLGWCAFEPTLAPDFAFVQRYTKSSSILSKERFSDDELKLDQLLNVYGFGSFDQIERVLSDGIRAGAFDHEALRKLLEDESKVLEREEAREAIRKPWTIFWDGLGDDQDAFIDALSVAFKHYSHEMYATEASEGLQLLRELGRNKEAGDFLSLYVQAQRDKPREFFSDIIRNKERLDPDIVLAFQAMLADTSIDKNPSEILREMVNSRSWDPGDLAYLASVPPEGYDKILKTLRGQDLRFAIILATDFGRTRKSDTNEFEFASRMAASLQRLAAKCDLNQIRLRPHLTNLVSALKLDDQLPAESDN